MKLNMFIDAALTKMSVGFTLFFKEKQIEMGKIWVPKNLSHFIHCFIIIDVYAIFLFFSFLFYSPVLINYVVHCQATCTFEG